MRGNDLSRRSLKKEESFKNEKGVSENASFTQIAIGAAPYVVVLILMLIILAGFPQLALCLPSTI